MRKPIQDELKYMYGVLDRPIVFFMGLLFAGVAGNLCYEIVHDYSKYTTLWKTWGIELGFTVVLLLAAYLVNRRYYEPKLKRDMRQAARMLRPRREEALKRSYKGIIWLLGPSPDSVEIARYAIAKHKLGLGDEAYGRGALQVCWCIYGAEDEKVKEELEQRLRELRTELEEYGIKSPIERYPISRPDAQQTFDAVNDIYRSKIRDYDLKPDEVVADIIGGYASMSVGMAVACHSMAHAVDIEYIEVPYLSNGGKLVRSREQESWNHLLIKPETDVQTSGTAP